MNIRSALITGIAVILSFIAGFIVANSINRKEIESLKGEVTRAVSSKDEDQRGKDDSVLTDDEIKQKIAQADSQPANIEFQKNLAIALYSYSSSKREIKWLPDVSRLLERVIEKEPKDLNTLISLGNINFDLGQKDKNSHNFEKARGFYNRALEVKQDNVEVIADLGLTYIFCSPAEPENAVTELRKALKLNPVHEKSLAGMVKALALSNKPQEAGMWLAKLKEVNPSNELIPELSAEIANPAASIPKQ